MKKVVTSKTMPPMGYVALGVLITLIISGVTIGAMNIETPISLTGVLCLGLVGVILVTSIVSIFSTNWAVFPGQRVKLIEQMETEVSNQLPPDTSPEYRADVEEACSQQAESAPVVVTDILDVAEFDTQEQVREKSQEDRLEELKTQVEELNSKLEGKRKRRTKKEKFVDDKLREILGEYYETQKKK